jgi:prepilin signal peptidase PulO-like enzyme (type II secretory pathway)
MYAPHASLVGHILTLALISVLIVIFLADIRYQIIPDEMQVAGLVVATALILVSPTASIGVFLQAMLAGLYTMLPIFAIYALTRGRGMGFGDVKWAFVMGYLLGFPEGWVALYAAFILGGVVGAALLLSSRAKLKQKIAFGPFLIAATVFVYFTQSSATASFLHLIGYQ